jgi:hypothetical protein
MGLYRCEIIIHSYLVKINTVYRIPYTVYDSMRLAVRQPVISRDHLIFVRRTAVIAASLPVVAAH